MGFADPINSMPQTIAKRKRKHKNIYIIFSSNKKAAFVEAALIIDIIINSFYIHKDHDEFL